MKRLSLIIIVSVMFLSSCGDGFVQKNGTIIEKVQTENKYGTPFFYIVVKTDDNKIERISDEDKYFNSKVGDRIIITVASW